MPVAGGDLVEVREPTKRFFRPDEVADLLLLSRRTVYRMIRAGRLEAVRLGNGPWRVPRLVIDELLGVGHARPSDAAP